MTTRRVLPDIDLRLLGTLASDPRVRQQVAAIEPLSRPPPAEVRICAAAYIPPEPRPATRKPETSKPPKAPKPPKNDEEPGVGTGFVFGTVFGVVLTIGAVWLLD